MVGAKAAFLAGFLGGGPFSNTEKADGFRCNGSFLGRSAIVCGILEICGIVTPAVGTKDETRAGARGDVPCKDMLDDVGVLEEPYGDATRGGCKDEL